MDKIIVDKTIEHVLVGCVATHRHKPATCTFLMWLTVINGAWLFMNNNAPYGSSFLINK
jgi:hypothetical protein